jgi:hypothetical protein
VKIWVAFLLGIFILASRPGALRERPRGTSFAVILILTAALLYNFRFV